MAQFISQFIGELSFKFYIFQVVTIFVLFLYGLIMMYLIRGKKLSFLDILLSFPLALIIYSCAGYFLLSFGISFNRATIVLALILVIGGAIAVAGKTKVDNDLQGICGENILKRTVCIVILALLLAMISTSGIFSVSVSNDSMYFFQEYPRALVNYGKLVSYLDNFLTDASQGIAIIGTIPFLFGFDEIFGIITFLNLNFLMIFVYAVYDLCSKRLEKKQAYVVTLVSLLMLISSMPYAIMSRWFMANMFFMEYMFIVVYLAFKYESEVCSASLIILSFFITGLSLMRMEGALNSGLLVMCIMMLGYKNKDIILYFVCPMLILQSMYLFRIFRILTLHTGYQFMTEQKAIVLIAFLVFIIVYCAFIRNRVFVTIQKYYKLLLVVGFFGLNILVLLYDRSDYITNIKAYFANVTRNSGWGLFISMIIGVLILIPKKSIHVNYFDITTVCYVLLTIVTGWARGDTLYESFGDSGNRILIQVVPLLVFAVSIKIIEGLKYWKEEKSN